MDKPPEKPLFLYKSKYIKQDAQDNTRLKLIIVIIRDLR